MGAGRWQGQVPCHLSSNGRNGVASQIVGLGQSQPLQEGQGDHTQHGMVVEALPGRALEVVQADFLLQLSVSQLTCPAALGHFHSPGQRRGGGQIADVVFTLLPSTLFPDDPGSLTRKVLTPGVLLTVGHAYVNSCEAS